MSKPILLLIDGYNVIAPIAKPGRLPRRSENSTSFRDPGWLHHERKRLLDRLAGGLPANVASRTCVVFDAANPPRDRPSRLEDRGIDVRFAVGYSEADELLEEIIAGHHSAKQLTVVSSDHRIHVAASRRGATCVDSEGWLDDLMDGKVWLVSWPAKDGEDSDQGSPSSTPPTSEKPLEDGLSDRQVQDWLKEFGLDP